MTIKKTEKTKAGEVSQVGSKGASTKKNKSKIKDKLLKELGRRLILTEEFSVGGLPSTPEKTEYGVIIYYNGAVRPNM